ncbi:MAG: acylphosphatase [Bacteroidales bacterium]|nr:acylphosphatase [Bacteroidales bacterium]
MDENHYKITVKGRVQGVGFRQSAKSEARFLGINGLVKNLSNGDVYIEAEGSKDQLDKFLEWCSTGSRYGYVESVQFETGELKNYSGFNISY